jgi:hypothetical protein
MCANTLSFPTLEHFFPEESNRTLEKREKKQVQVKIEFKLKLCRMILMIFFFFLAFSLIELSFSWEKNMNFLWVKMTPGKLS